MIIVLLGYMASGKSAVGKELGSVLSYPFIDLDAYIEEKEGLTISEIFDQKGVIYFRKKEAENLRSILTRSKNLVLALGGGTPCYSNNMDVILNTENAISIYLKASINTLATRLKIEVEKRPLVKNISGEDELLEFIGKHMFERRNFYTRAKHSIITDEKEISEINQDIVAKLFKNG